MKTKTILVTGGAGFIGSHLCSRLLEKGHEVICLDNFFSGRKRNMLPLMDRPRFEIIRHDVSMPIFLEVDEIYNLACPASPIYYQKDPVQTTKVCVLGALNMLEIANRLKVPILQASTSEVYGDPLIHPQTEEYFGNVNPIGVRSCYDEGKRCAETLFFDYHRQHDLEVKVVRIFNTYGPNMSCEDGRVVSNFIVQALRNEDITVYGDGLQSRSFCYVDDMVDGLIAMMATDRSVTGPINLGRPVEHSILHLAETIIRLLGSKSNIRFGPVPSDDPRHRKPDITKALEILKWQPETPIEEGLVRTIAYFRQELGL